MRTKSVIITTAVAAMALSAHLRADPASTNAPASLRIASQSTMTPIYYGLIGRIAPKTIDTNAPPGKVYNNFTEKYQNAVSIPSGKLRIAVDSYLTSNKMSGTAMPPFDWYYGTNSAEVVQIRLPDSTLVLFFGSDSRILYHSSTLDAPVR